MSRDSQAISESNNYFIAFIKPTEDDLKRVFTEEELKELCLKHKCKVDIWRWNAVNDYRILFTQSGRYQRWSERQRLRMVAKAVNKMKPLVLYDEMEIAITREREWKIQLKENILALNFWKRRAKGKTVETKLQCENNASSSEIRVIVESERFSEVNTNSNKRLTYTQIAATKLTQSIIEDDLEEEYLERNESEYLLKTVMLKEKQQENSREMWHSDDINTAIGNIFNVNTMSMTIEPESSIKSQDIGMLQSNHMILQDYKNFKKSQSKGSEKVIGECENYNGSEDLLTILMQNEKQKDSPKVILHSNETDIEIGSIYDINTMSMIVDSDISQPSQNLRTLKPQNGMPYNSDVCQPMAPLLTATQGQKPEEECSINNVSENVFNTIISNQKQKLLQLDETDTEIENMYDINTTSITIDSEMSTQSQDLVPLHSQNMIPQNYEHFKSILPLTSTQSPSEGSY